MAENTAQMEQVSKALLEKEGKYLTFALGREEYGLEILKVREIIGYIETIRVYGVLCPKERFVKLREERVIHEIKFALIYSE